MVARCIVLLAAWLALPACGDNDEVAGSSECELCTSSADCNESIGLECLQFPDGLLRCALPAGSECGVEPPIEPPIEPPEAGSALPGVVVADFDGDGCTDLALVAEDAVSGIEVRLAARPDQPIGIATDDPVTTLAAADVDADGTVDLIAASAAVANVSWLRGAGDGGFTAAARLALDFAPVLVAAADLDHAGGADLVLGSASGREIAVVLARPGELRAAPPLTTIAQFDRVVLRDVDRDGTTDLVVYDAKTRRGTAFRGRGDGAFSDRWPPRR